MTDSGPGPALEAYFNDRRASKAAAWCSAPERSVALSGCRFRRSPTRCSCSQDPHTRQMIFTGSRLHQPISVEVRENQLLPATESS
jgi:hypothetical protein